MTPISMIAPLLACCLFGCTVLGTVPARQERAGIGYMLPKGLVPVEVVQTSDALELRIKDPILVGDSSSIYTLKRSGNVFSSDNTAITVDPKTGLLTAIDAKSEDKSLEAIKNLISALKAESGETEVVIYRSLFDPGFNSEQGRAFNEALVAAVQRYLVQQAEVLNCDTEKTAECIQLRRSYQAASADEFGVAVEGANPVPDASTAPPDCSLGVCYRLNVPHVLTLRASGITNTAVLGLPNRSPTFVLPVERWAFVKTSHDIKFAGGVFSSQTVDRPSSALALASAPLDIAKAVLTAVSEVIQLKIDTSGKEKALADAKVAEIEAEAALDKALLEKAGSKAENAVLGTAAGAPVLRLAIGPGSSLLPKRVGAGQMNPTPGVSSGSGSSDSAGSAGSAGGNDTSRQ